MRTLLASILALVLSVAFISGVMAQQEQKSAPSGTAPASAALEKFSGTVEKIDAAKKEIVVKKGGEQKSFVWSDHTKFMQEDKAMSFSDLKKGMDVTVAYKKEGTKSTVERIDFSKPKTSG